MDKKRPLWEPNSSVTETSEMAKFRHSVNSAYSTELRNYHELYEWSVNSNIEFWSHLLLYSGIQFSGSVIPVINNLPMPETRWFENCKLNFAANLLRMHHLEKQALLFQNESGHSASISYKSLYSKVKQIRYVLKKKGVTAGDRVAGLTTNSPQAIIAMLAATSLGAVWTSCSPDFGFNGVFDRFSQVQPKLLFAVREYEYGGKVFSQEEKILRLKENIPSIESVITYSSQNDLVSFHDIDLSAIDATVIDTIETWEQFPFNHPTYIMYSSGTTGKPKCMVHGAGGTLLQHYKEHALHTDLKQTDCLFFFTTCGWMMWNWLVSGLFTGATLVLYDGNPFYPHTGALWQLIDSLGISVFGISPKFLSHTEKMHFNPMNSLDLGTLRTILSTGSPLTTGNYQFVYSSVKQDIMLSSISGGTDIISCFMLGCPELPVFEGEIQCRGLGMAVLAFNESSEPVYGEKGELVCVKPAPSMPVYFWNDDNFQLYRKAYFQHFQGIWRHGDFVEINPVTGGIIVYGRSDATLNPGGVRIGTAEIYSAVEALNDIKDSIVVGQKYNDDVRLLLFVVMREGVLLSETIIQNIKKAIRTTCTPRHVPEIIVAVPDIPRTISGKKVEIAVTRLLNNETIDNADAIANPESLQYFRTVFT